MLSGCSSLTQQLFFLAGSCSAGYFCDGESTRPDHKQCPPGFYCPEGSESPVPCSPGHFNSERGKWQPADCQLCPAGYFCSGECYVFESWDLHSVKWGEVGASTALFCTAHITFTKHKHPVLFHLYFCGVFHSNQNTTCYSMSSLFLGSDTFCRCILKEFSLSGKQNSLADRYLVQLSARVSALRQLLRGSHNLFAQYMYLLPPTTLKYLRSHWW